jgi:uncharacterized protein YcbK (DUF882 family)
MTSNQIKSIWLVSVFIFISLMLSFAAESRTLDQTLMIKLQRLKTLTKCNYKVTSGHRSRSHNKAVGGVPESFHLRGKALDLKPFKSCKLSLKQIGRKAVRLFNGVIVYRYHIHVDIGNRIYNNL